MFQLTTVNFSQACILTLIIAGDTSLRASKILYIKDLCNVSDQHVLRPHKLNLVLSVTACIQAKNSLFIILRGVP